MRLSILAAWPLVDRLWGRAVCQKNVGNLMPPDAVKVQIRYTGRSLLLPLLLLLSHSAPEILLAVVESILRLGRPAGELGPSTIVGSAAYNLIMIAAVCTASLPIGESNVEVKRIYCLDDCTQIQFD